MKKIRKRRTFTLIELLVVVAIIGILVTILMPSLHKAREMSKRAVCLSNLKQLGTVASLYGRRNNGFLSPSRGKSANDHVSFYLHKTTIDEFNPYIGDWQVSDCPNFGLSNTKEKGKAPINGSSMIGYNYLAAMPVNKLKGPGDNWQSPFYLSDENDLALFTDRLQGAQLYRSFYPHGATGWQEYSSWAANPSQFGSQGAHQVLLDTSARWNPASTLTGQKASSVDSVIMWWKNN